MTYANCVAVQKFDEIEKLCFDKYLEKMQQENPLDDWNSDKFQIAVSEYKRFLTLKRLYPGLSLSPTKLMDAVWHSHILDTKQYHLDCGRIYGKYLHHSPQFGLSKNSQQTEAKENLLRLYKQNFGSLPVGHSTSACYDICQDDGGCE